MTQLGRDGARFEKECERVTRLLTTVVGDIMVYRNADMCVSDMRTARHQLLLDIERIGEVKSFLEKIKDNLKECLICKISPSS